MRRYKRVIEELDRFLVTNWSFINSPSAKVGRGTFSVAEWKAFIIAKYHVDALAAALCVRFKHFDNQLPVGLFSGKLANKTQVIPARRSAIDLWGIDNTGAAHIFKLKDDGNRKIGIISELLFYVYVVTGVQKGTFCHTPDNAAAAVFRKTFMENGEISRRISLCPACTRSSRPK